MAQETFTAKVEITMTAPTVYKTERYKTEEVETGPQYRNILDITLTASTLEKLQEKIVAHVGLAE